MKRFGDKLQLQAFPFNYHGVHQKPYGFCFRYCFHLPWKLF